MWWTRKRSKSSEAADAEASSGGSGRGAGRGRSGDAALEAPQRVHPHGPRRCRPRGVRHRRDRRASSAPVFFALVLTICVHPLARVAREARRAARHRHRIGDHRRDAAAARVRLRSCSSRSGSSPSCCRSSSDQISAFGQDVAAWLASIGISADEISDIAAGFDPATLLGFVGGLVGGLTGWITLLVIIFTMLLLMAMDAGFVPTVLRAAVPGAAARRGLARELRQQRAPVHGRHHGARARAGHRQLDRAAHPRRARRVHLGTARVRLLLHPEHRLLHRDHPADHLRRRSSAAGRR